MDREFHFQLHLSNGRCNGGYNLRYGKQCLLQQYCKNLKCNGTGFSLTTRKHFRIDVGLSGINPDIQHFCCSRSNLLRMDFAFRLVWQFHLHIDHSDGRFNRRHPFGSSQQSMLYKHFENPGRDGDNRPVSTRDHFRFHFGLRRIVPDIQHCCCFWRHFIHMDPPIRMVRKFQHNFHYGDSRCKRGNHFSYSKQCMWLRYGKDPQRICRGGSRSARIHFGFRYGL